MRNFASFTLMALATAVKIRQDTCDWHSFEAACHEISPEAPTEDCTVFYNYDTCGYQSAWVEEGGDGEDLTHYFTNIEAWNVIRNSAIWTEEPEAAGAFDFWEAYHNGELPEEVYDQYSYEWEDYSYEEVECGVTVAWTADCKEFDPEAPENCYVEYDLWPCDNWQECWYNEDGQWFSCTDALVDPESWAEMSGLPVFMDDDKIDTWNFWNDYHAGVEDHERFWWIDAWVDPADEWDYYDEDWYGDEDWYYDEDWYGEEDWESYDDWDLCEWNHWEAACTDFDASASADCTVYYDYDTCGYQSAWVMENDEWHEITGSFLDYNLWSEISESAAWTDFDKYETWQYWNDFHSGNVEDWSKYEWIQWFQAELGDEDWEADWDEDWDADWDEDWEEDWTKDDKAQDELHWASDDAFWTFENMHHHVDNIEFIARDMRSALENNEERVNWANDVDEVELAVEDAQNELDWLSEEVKMASDDLQDEIHWNKKEDEKDFYYEEDWDDYYWDEYNY